jgi:hypothetical protein
MDHPAERPSIPCTDQTGYREIGIDRGDMFEGFGLAEDDVLALLRMAELEHSALAVREANPEILIPLAFEGDPAFVHAIGFGCEA